MGIYFGLGIIVGILETISALHDLKEAGFTIEDIFPFGQFNRLTMVCWYIKCVGAITIIWPLQVAFWLYKLVSGLTSKTKIEV